MKKLNELLNCPYDIDIESIEDDSRIRSDNSLFCCIEGLTVDGHKFINNAINNGAVAILASKNVKSSVPVVKVKDTNKAMLEVLSNFYNNVDEKIKLIGVTGTNGKTTVSNMIYQLINNISKAGYIGTNGIECQDFTAKTIHTTPFPKELFKTLNDFYQVGCKYVALEVSSERLLTKRIDNLEFDVAIFTNLGKDHINAHKSYKNYRDSKSKLMMMTKKSGYAIINNDDPSASFFEKKARGRVLTYGIENDADITATDIIISEQKLIFNINGKLGEYRVESPLSGRFNVYNIMAALLVCYALGFNIDDMIEGIKKLKPIKGRVEMIDYNGRFKVIVDYAHSADALKNLLEFVRVMCSGKIITVTGSAGGRDHVKRPDMGKVVTDLSDYVIFTTDDPRYEDPNDIIDDMISSLNNKNNYERIIDRSLAIEKALSLANPGDVVVIAGRGNDTYMPIGDKFIRCNDIEEVYKNLAREESLI